MDNIQHSYQLQRDSEVQMGWPSRFSAPDSIDNWRHTRMLSGVQPLIAALPDGEWMTVGDGRYGSDAAFLKGRGARATATTLTDDRLRVAYERGFIDAFRIENAERLSIADNSVDFVLCKEAYHHFPRPPLALYEMLRVARRAVVLIEPLDEPKLLDGVRTLAKRVLRGDKEFEFEPSGNFLYRLSLRELAKLYCAMGGRTMAFRGVNDFYHPRFGAARADRISLASAVTRTAIAVQDVLAGARLIRYSLGVVVLFKDATPSALLDPLVASGFRAIELPRNPYS